MFWNPTFWRAGFWRDNFWQGLSVSVTPPTVFPAYWRAKVKVATVWTPK